MAAAARLGYRPNRLAAGLRGGRTSSVGMVWQFANPWTTDAIIALDVIQHQQQRGYAAYQAQYSDDVDMLCQQLDDLLNRRVDALVVWGIPAQLRNPNVQRRLAAVPTVAVTREPIDGMPCDLVVHSRRRAIEDVVDYLVATGRRRPAMSISLAQESNPPKYEIFLERCRHHGVADHPHTLIDLSFPDAPEHIGAQHAEGLRAAFPDKVEVDAIFCFNDIGAMYVSRELSSRGVAVPDEVAVVGFNDTQAGRVWLPPLASGDRRPREVARVVDDLLRRRLEDPDRPHEQRTVEMEFIWRESAGPRMAGIASGDRAPVST